MYKIMSWKMKVYCSWLDKKDKIDRMKIKIKMRRV